MRLTDREVKILTMLEGQDCSAGEGMLDELLSLEERGLLSSRFQLMLDGNRRVGEPGAIRPVKFFRTSAKGRRAVARATAAERSEV